MDWFGHKLVLNCYSSNWICWTQRAFPIESYNVRLFILKVGLLGLSVFLSVKVMFHSIIRPWKETHSSFHGLSAVKPFENDCWINLTIFFQPCYNSMMTAYICWICSEVKFVKNWIQEWWLSKTLEYKKLQVDHSRKTGVWWRNVL